MEGLGVSTEGVYKGFFAGLVEAFRKFRSQGHGV